MSSTEGIFIYIFSKIAFIEVYKSQNVFRQAVTVYGVTVLHRGLAWVRTGVPSLARETLSGFIRPFWTERSRNGACCSHWKHATVYGNIHRQSLASAWNSEKLKNFQLMHLRRQRIQIDFCKDCYVPSMDNVDGKEAIIIEKIRNRKD